MNVSLEEFQKEDIYFKNDMAVEVLKKFMGYRVKLERDGEISYVDGTLMPFALLDSWMEFVLTTMDTEISRDGKQQTMFSLLYGKYLRRAVASLLKVGWEAVRDAQDGNFDNDGTSDEEEKTECGTLKRIATVAVCVPSVKKLYLAVRKEYILENTTKLLGAVLDFFE